MLFTSPVFIFLFLPISLLAYFIAPTRIKNTILLLASLFFYAWGELTYVLLMLASISCNYLLGRLIQNVSNNHWLLALGLCLNLIPLLFFKYAHFIADNIGIELNISIHLPLGISFFTFQAISYLIDVYRKRAQAEHNILNLGLFISLFPQLIAGPIVRFNQITQQIIQRHVNLRLFSSGVERFVFGLAKKLLIANSLAALVDPIFALPHEQISWALAWLAITGYALQIYFDFSAYSDMAIGLARMFGFKLEENFNYPYIAQSLQEFWRRWHISLSKWFRDYLYIPLGGNRLGPLRTYFNLCVVFLLCGLWHGASWNFIIWGMIHGIFLVIERLEVSQKLPFIPRWIRHLYVCLVVLIAWVFFRMETIPEAMSLLSIMFAGNEQAQFYTWNYFINNQIIWAFCCALLLSTPIFKSFALQPAQGALIWFKTMTVAALLCLSCIMISANTYNPFIYFRF